MTSLQIDAIPRNHGGQLVLDAALQMAKWTMGPPQQVIVWTSD
jgi:hypothetical protein